MGKGGRPVGEIRAAIVKAVQEIRADGGVVHFRSAGARACVGFEAARSTLRDMERGGQLVRAGEAKIEGVKRPVLVYDVAGGVVSCDEEDAGEALGRVLVGWVDLG